MHVRIENIILNEAAAEALRETGCEVDIEKMTVVCPEDSTSFVYPSHEGMYGVVRIKPRTYMLWHRENGDRILFIGEVGWDDDEALFQAAISEEEPTNEWLREVLLHRLGVVYRIRSLQKKVEKATPKDPQLIN